MDIYSSFKPTYLYIKQHRVTGKLYFGKTVQNPETYMGSGLHWKTHIRKHGRKHVVTLWYCLFLDKESCTEFALKFSKQHNIVESDEWLNLKEENGTDGGTDGSFMRGKRHNEDTRERIRIKMIGRTFSDETRAKLSSAARLQERRPVPDEQRKRISKTMLGMKRQSLTCPHCGKIGGSNGMKRYHFDNCKLK